MHIYAHIYLGVGETPFLFSVEKQQQQQQR